MLSRIIKNCICLLVFLLPVFWLSFSLEIFEFNKQYLLFFLVSSAFICWIAKMVLIDKEIRFKRSPFDIFVLAFLAISILSAISSVDKYSSIYGFYGRFSNGLISLLSLGVLYFLITNNVEAKKIENSKLQLNTIIKLFLWSVFFVILCTYLSIFGIRTKIIDLMGGNLSLPSVMLQRTFNPAAGSLESLAVFLSIVVVFLTGLMIIQKLDSRFKKLFYWFLLISSLVLLMIIDFTPAWLILLISFAIFVIFSLFTRLFKEDVNRLLLPISIIIIGIVFLFINTSSLQFGGFSQIPKEQTLNQGISWQTSLKAATENIKSGFLGSGLGTFHYDFAKFKPVEFNMHPLWQIRFDRSGSHIAEILATMGFLGFISYVMLIGMFLFAGYLFFRRNYEGIPLFLAFLALIISQFFFYQNTVLAFTFWLVMGLSVISWQKPVREKVISFKEFPELSLVFSVLFIFLVIVIMGTYFFAAKFYLAEMSYKNTVGTSRIENLEKAAALNPYQPQYKMVLSRAYLNLISAELAKPAEQGNQTDLLNYVHRAITYSKSGQIEANQIKGATDLAPNRVAAWETLGVVYRDIQGIVSGSLDWGIKSFEKAIVLEPTNPVLYTELGKLYLAREENEKAKEEFLKAKELKPDYADALVQLAFLLEQEGKINEAIKEMENLAASYPFNAEILFQLGRLYFNANRVDEAIIYFKTVVSLAPNHSNAHYSLGAAYEAKGEINKAIAELEKVLELNPGNRDVQQRLQRLRGY